MFVLFTFLCPPIAACLLTAERPDEPPLPEESRQALVTELDERIAGLTRRIAAEPENVALYSRRGDAHFFRARFRDAVADYQRMVDLDSELEASHWRRGIALFYAGEYEKAARQFEAYHHFDDVDRENGIWRYLSQVKAYGRDKAREGLLRYQKDDREPFPAVYKLFAGDMAPEEILRQIAEAKVDDAEREKRLFYAHLYIGLNHAVEDAPQAAARHLREAVANEWGRGAAFGPNYMWHVGRLEYDRIAEQPARNPRE